MCRKVFTIFRFIFYYYWSWRLEDIFPSNYKNAENCEYFWNNRTNSNTNFKSIQQKLKVWRSLLTFKRPFLNLLEILGKLCGNFYEFKFQESWKKSTTKIKFLSKRRTFRFIPFIPWNPFNVEFYKNFSKKCSQFLQFITFLIW